MTRRLSFVTNLAHKYQIDDAQLSQNLGNNFAAKTQTAIADSPPRLRAALILGSPEFMYR
jgi:hypothetical protein